MSLRFVKRMSWGEIAWWALGPLLLLALFLMPAIQRAREEARLRLRRNSSPRHPTIRRKYVSDIRVT